MATADIFGAHRPPAIEEALKWQPFMRRALALAESAIGLGEVPVGALVVHQNQIVAEAHNVREATHDPLGHAEVLALRQAARALGRWRLIGATLVVTLEPCCMCAGAIVNSRVDRIVFGAHDPKAGAAGSLMNLVADARLNHRADIISGVMAEASQGLLRQFFRARRRLKLQGG